MEVNALQYPPTWFFGIVGSACYLLIQSTLNADLYTTLCGWSLFIFAAVFLACNHFLAPTKKRRIKNNSEFINRNVENLALDIDALKKWLSSEKAIENPSNDYFDFHITSRRIVNLLRKNSLCKIGLIGPFGSGKSSLIELLKNELLTATADDEFQNEIIPCHFAAWGVLKGSIASVLLEKISESIGEHADSLSIRELPYEYRAALSNSGSGILAWLENLLSHPQEPEVILRKVDKILSCIDKRLVIFIEDIDRNTTSNEDMNDFAALLDRLKDLSRVSFIFAVGPEAYMHIMLRVCDHVKGLPKISNFTGISVLSAFRKMCFNEYSADVEIVSRDKRDKQFGFIENSARELVFAMEEKQAPDAIIELLYTPRMLKNVLSKTWRLWQNLHGEIDLDDIIVANTLQVSAPSAFALIHEHISNLKHISTPLTYEGDGRKKRVDRFREAWDEVKKQKNEIYNIRAVESLLEFLFPGAIKDHSHAPIVGRQRINFLGDVDYWERYNAEIIPQKFIRDQEMIAALKLWRENSTSAILRGQPLVDALYRSKNNEQAMINQWGNTLDALSLRLLALELVKKAVREQKTKACENSTPGLLPLWHASREVKTQISVHREYVTKMLQESIPTSLTLAIDIYRHWSRQDKPSLPEQDSELRTAFLCLLKATFENKPDNFLNALNPANVFTLRQLIQVFQDTNGSVDIAKDFPWLAQALRTNLKQNPSRIFPFTLYLLTNQDRNNLVRFEETLYKSFGSEANDLMRDLDFAVKNIDTSKFDEKRMTCLKLKLAELIK